MKVLITGGAGFIGSNFVYYLLSKKPNWQICVVDLLTYAGNLDNLTEPLNQKKIDFIKADITDSKAIDKIFAENKFDLCFHFAAESHVDRSIHSAIDFVKTNVLGTQVLLEASKKNNLSRFIHISTDEVYGSLGPTGRFYETTPLDPSSPYSASKASSDLIALAYFKTFGLDVLVTRCTNNYGPYQFPEKLIPLFISNLLEDKKVPLYGDGMNVRSWLYVEDHCEAILLLSQKGRAGEIYNIGGTESAEVPNKYVTLELLKILNKDESLIEWVADRPAHDRRYAVSIDKINTELGWSPKTNFSKGLKTTVQWYLDNQSWWQKIKTGEYLEFYNKNYSNR